MAEFTLRIDGMHCGSCVRRVSQALASTEGVRVNEVLVGAARLTSTAEPCARRAGHCRSGQGRLLPRIWKPDPSWPHRNRIPDPARAGHDLRLLPAPC